MSSAGAVQLIVTPAAKGSKGKEYQGQEGKEPCFLTRQPFERKIVEEGASPEEEQRQWITQPVRRIGLGADRRRRHQGSR